MEKKVIANDTNRPKIIDPDLSYEIMGAIFEVHKQLEVEFLGSIYEKALIEELSIRGMKVETKKVIYCNLQE